MTTIREEIESILMKPIYSDVCTEEIIKVVKKQMRSLEMEYRKRRMFDLDPKVVFEDIRDILDGKTYAEIFFDEEEFKK